ncbi:MAG TPA: fumarylacetoacetate hydrolase family protein [Pyrinomonadaceae bacterium]|nr:fumarylacetoacetate hydrolase family protein [Pyrinomonadaceae bacterium]
MKLAQFRAKGGGARRLGVLLEGELWDAAALAAAVEDSGAVVPAWLVEADGTASVIGGGEEALAELGELLTHARRRGIVEEARAHGVARERHVRPSPDAYEFLPPVFPGKILAIGRNYVDHAIEGGEAPPGAPLIFTKLPNSLAAHGQPVTLHAISSQIDYEAELAVVVGRRARRVSEREALNHVFGYTLINDVSARDLQFGDGQWVRGKGLDGFAPVGPYVTTRDEVRDVQALRIEGRLNGETMQSSNTSKMIFGVAHLVSYISQGITLEPGDVIATGTPEGVGVFRKPPVLLKDGDTFEVEVEGLGTLSNTFVSPEN